MTTVKSKCLFDKLISIQFFFFLNSISGSFSHVSFVSIGTHLDNFHKTLHVD